MTQVSNQKSLKTLFAVTLIAATLGLSACSKPVDPDVKARQDIMKNFGDAMKVMGGMAKEPDTFDADVFKEQATFLAEESKNPWSHFNNPGMVGGAKDAVWSNADGFKAEAENFQKVTAELATAAQTATSIDEVMPAFKPVGDSCKSCHTDFQVKKDD